MPKPLTVAVIGLGYFSQFHLDAWAQRKDVRITGLSDPDVARRNWAAETYTVPVFPDLAALLTTTDPDIVDIVAPPPTHLDLIRALARKNRILICQKPFCQGLAEAEEASKLADEAGATLIIHENFRFQPWYRTLKTVLDDGRLGQVWQCRFALRPGDGRGDDAYLSRQPAFRAMKRLLIHETGVHFIDLFRWLFGDITGVYADLRQINPVLAGEDAAVLLLDHSSGVRTQFDGNRLLDHATDNPRRTMGEMLVEGATGTLRLDGQGRLFLRGFGARDETQIPLIAPVDETSFGGGCVAALIAHVAAAARGDGPFENEAHSYLPVIRATEAAYLSAETGQKQRL